MSLLSLFSVHSTIYVWLVKLYLYTPAIQKKKNTFFKYIVKYVDFLDISVAEPLRCKQYDDRSRKQFYVNLWPFYIDVQETSYHVLHHLQDIVSMHGS